MDDAVDGLNSSSGWCFMAGRQIAILPGTILPVLCAMAAVAASASGDQKESKAWIDARGVCIFPLSGRNLPRTRDELGTSLSHAWDKTMQVPDSSKVVQMEGEGYPSLQSLRIDLSDSTIPSGKSDKIKPSNKPQSQVGVDRFEFIGSPLMCDSAKLNVSISAADAHLDIERDRTGKPILLLTDAKSATLKFDATGADLQKILVEDLRTASAPYGVRINGASLHLMSDNEHSISVDLYVSTQIALMPAGMRFKAHVDIDDKMQATLTGLSCDGDRLLGPLIVGLLRPGLAQYEGKTRPLFSFPSPKLHLHDISLHVDDSIHLNAGFGS
jgi:hypothetical protein